MRRAVNPLAQVFDGSNPSPSTKLEVFMERKQIGRIGLSMAINYFTCQGYTVSLPMNDTQ